MKIVTNASELLQGCAFVPTMGALHSGHQSLFKIAATQSENVLASIFVNPLQFENAEDLEKYPRTPERDIEMAEAAGVTHLWFPRYEELYPEGFCKVNAGPLGDLYEGASRPGHFDGVVTVVSRLFELAKPMCAIFGEKDFQQLTLIKILDSGVRIIPAPTIRESDGLALSSRNVRLDADGRKAATVISRALVLATSQNDLENSRQTLNEILATEATFTIDYAQIIDEKDFSQATEETAHARAIVAGWINGIRLIDNMPMKNRADAS
ncbi:MAG: pantoate--beta-alanine ligase [Candidatus Planktophila sp.]